MKLLKIAAVVPVLLLVVFLAVFLSNSREQNAHPNAGAGYPANTLAFLAPGDTQIVPGPQVTDPDREAFVFDFWRWVLSEAGIPAHMANNIITSVLESPAFIMELLVVLQHDPLTFHLVDKQNALPSDFFFFFLVPLTAGDSFRITRNDLSLRPGTAAALEEMAAAAAADGVILTLASSYRSFARQSEIFAWNVHTFGLEEAQRFSARPGHSEHQLGMAVDFYPINASFVHTAAWAWLENNASRFGWSLSYPDGFEHVTGYIFEPWHFRYVGRDLTAFINNYFEGVQQFALQFIQVWQKHAEEQN
jgi:D-alanyl-D-alanine carboxypeptidase